jgi:hypothetical protein
MTGKTMKVDEELTGICREIMSEGKTEAEWAEVEASDWFQTDKYCGGFDADDREFGFTVMLPDGQFCFGFPLNTAKEIAEGKCTELAIERSPWA